MNEAQPNIEAANRRFIDVGYLEDNPAELQRLSIAAYRLLLDGKPVTNADIAAATRIPEVRVCTLFKLIPESAYDRDDRESITAFIGLSIKPANHEFIVGGRTFYTWCVFDGLFLPELIGKQATIGAKCPATGADIHIKLSQTEIIGATSEEIVMSMVDPDMDACCDDLRGAFCNNVNFFASEAVFKDWANDKPEYACVTLEEAYALAKARNRARYPDITVTATEGRAA